jgi:radical SAM superfamily enzyme YgiQ (UPF0313 family)
MPDIVLTTLNARYIHASFGLRYLMANLGPLSDRAAMLEFDSQQRSVEVIEAILALQPKIVGIGVYIWNAGPSLQLVAEIKRVCPQIIVVIGGPEVSYEIDEQEICRLADYVITGEADRAFARLCEQLLTGRRPLMKVIAAPLPEFEASDDPIVLPYHLYNQEDLAHRVVYVEASRGCPFKCEFCLSSLDVPVRNVPLQRFLGEMQNLLDRGCRVFKFVDRTFNLNLHLARSILDFFFDRYEPGLFLHFEMIPDRLPTALRQAISRFPAGALQFEVGVQTFNEAVSARISRRQDNQKLEENLRWLRNGTGVHVHADLIVGLPGEDLQSFGAGFDRLLGLRPHEIQVGMLKRLRGTPIVRHDEAFSMIYSPQAPYEVLQTSAMDFTTVQRMRRFGRYWDLFGNSRNFTTSLPMLWPNASPFERFLRFADWLHEKLGRQHGIALQMLAEQLLRFVVDELDGDASSVAQAIWQDYQAVGRSDRPAFLQKIIDLPMQPRAKPVATLKRQARHLGHAISADPQT